MKCMLLPRELQWQRTNKYVTQDPEGSHRRGHIQAHEAADALGLASSINLHRNEFQVRQSQIASKCHLQECSICDLEYIHLATLLPAPILHRNQKIDPP